MFVRRGESSLITLSAEIEAARVSPGTLGIIPSDVGDLTCWLDANAEAFSDDDLVDTWSDQSASGFDFTAATSLQPTFKTGIVNGKPVIRFDGVANNMDSGTNVASFITSAIGTVFAVFNVTTIDVNSDNATQPWLNDPIWADISGFTGQQLRNTGPTLQNWSWDGNSDIAAHTISTGTWYHTTYRHEGGNLVSTINGGDEQTVASGNRTGGGTVHVGKGQSDFYAGDLAELIFYDVAVSATDRAGIEKYLKDKYDL